MKTLFTEEMRYLGWKQPYAQLMLQGKVETRTWNTKYRGLVLITASASPYSDKQLRAISGDEQFVRIMDAITDVSIELGYAIAVGKLIDSRPMTKADENKCFVAFKEGLYCHVYTDIKPIEPIKIKGHQGWKKLSDEFIATIKYL